MADPTRAKRYYVSGMVQGVGYRFFAQRVAEQLGVAGYVKNLRDGRVEVYAIGSPENLAALRAELERGPHAAMVSRLVEEEAGVDARYASGFSIEFDRG
jgi:acylphosphatase